MAASPHNPYIAGNPVGDTTAYVGRDDVLRAVLRVLRHDQQNAIVLYGQRRIGKTSVLQHMRAHLPEEGPYFPVYFDLQDKAAMPLSQVLQDLANAIAQALDQPAPDLGSDAAATFRDNWLPAVLNALPEGSSVVLLLDEFDVLADAAAEQAAKAFFPYIREMLASDPARLKFDFVIGRNIDDLDNIALSVFKGTEARRISLFSREDCAALARLSEANDTLLWADDAEARIWELTNGHPFLTQSLCSHVWERAYDQRPAAAPTVTVADVDAAVPEALDASRNTMEWLWAGLPPAERVVASTLAEAGSTALSPDALERLLHDAGVRVVIRELQSAPALLQEWDLIEPTDGGFRFRVELLRRWIAENKPLRRVQEELDYIEPVAENLYQAAMGLYQGGQLEGSVDLLRRAVALNPNHVRASQLLADNLLAKGSTDEAVELLERLFQYQPAAARPRLVQALLSLAQKEATPEAELQYYERVLALDPVQPEARAGKRRIWKQRGDAALEAGDLEAAIQAYEMAGSADSVRKVKEERRHRNLATDLEMVEKAERGGAYPQALELARILSERYPEDRDWAADLERLERQARLKELYQRALGALHSGDRQTAQGLLVQVVSLAPDYEEATRYLHLAVTGVDPGKPPAEPKAQEAPPTPEIKPTDQQQLPPIELKFWELLWWLVARPDRLKAHREVFGQEGERRMGAWLASTLTWLPLFLLAVRLAFFGDPDDENLVFTLLTALGCLVAWAVIGSLGSSSSIPGRAVRWATWLAGIVTFVAVLFAVALASQFMLWASSFDFYAIPVAAVALAIGGALGVAIIVAPGIVQGVAAGALAGVAFGGWVPSLRAYVDPALAWLCIAAGLLGLGLAAALRAGLRQSLKVGRHSWLVYGAFLVVGIAYVFLFVTA